MAKMRIEDLDTNFAAENIGDDLFRFYDVTENPFKVYGFYSTKQKEFNRMPLDFAQKVNERVLQLARQTSGGRIRFKTDSEKIAIKFSLPELHLMKHMPLTGSSFFDLYIDGEYKKPFYPTADFHDSVKAEKESEDGLISVVNLNSKVMREIEINFPLYNAVSEVCIGLLDESLVLPGKEYCEIKPVVYYGSSITQGGCASHPGNAYANIISRRLNCDFVNLGFSGNCKAEMIMCDYISALDMSVFVFDYDHNAPNAEFLQQTHEPFFKAFRQRNPDTPVLFVSAADKPYIHNDECKDVIYNTYRNAVNSGDKNVYFIDGKTIYENVGYDLCTVDGCHPNDLGFWCMANSIGAVIKDILNK